MTLGFAAVAFVVGLVLLVKGADWLVHGSGSIAEGAGISKLVVGLTVVAFGTSAPELAATIGASLKEGAEGLVVGAVVGSNIANLALILGVSGVMRWLPCDRGVVYREMPIMIGVMALGVVAMLGGSVTRVEGVGMVALLAIYIAYQYMSSRKARVLEREKAAHLEEPPLKNPKGWWFKQIGLVLIGVACLTGGAELLVRGSVTIATALGVPEFIVGLTMVAFGTSLPELATSIRAAMRGHSELAVGNIVGSNVFNVLGVLGVTSAIFGAEVPQAAMQRDVWVMLALGVVLVPMLRVGWGLGRLGGSFLLAVYAAYLVTVFVQQS